MRIAIKPQPQGGAVSYFRGTAPGHYALERGHEVAFLHSAYVAPEAQRVLVETADVVHLVGAAGVYEEAGPEWRKRRGVLSIDLDDDLWVWSADPARELAERHKMVAGPFNMKGGREAKAAEVEKMATWLRAADVVTTTTEALAETIRARVPGVRRVEVCPNAITPEMGRSKPKAGGVLERAGFKRHRAPVDRPGRVVAWTGSVAHVADLPPVLEALARVRSVDGGVTVRSLGPVDFMDVPGFKEVFKGSTDYTPVVSRTPDGKASMLVPFERYYETLEAMAPDVAVIPMRESPFNAGKSAVTLYSWAVQGVPCVVSDFGPYSEAKRDGFPARYVPPLDVEAWVRELRDLLYDKPKAAALGRAAEAWVLERHAFPRAVDRWLDVWSVAAREREPKECGR